MARPAGCRIPVVTMGRRLLPSIHDDSIFGAAPASAQYMRPSCGSTTTDVGNSRPVLMTARRYRPSVLATITRPRGFEPERSVSVQYRLLATQSTARLVGFELPVQQTHSLIHYYIRVVISFFIVSEALITGLKNSEITDIDCNGMYYGC